MVLILGGVKSGKSSFASQRAREREALGPVIYLATARAGDEEMAERIERHRYDRPPSWITCEEPLDPAGVFHAGRAESSATIILDCVSMWLTNVLAPLGETPNRKEAMSLGEGEVEALLDSIHRWEKGAAPGDRQCLLVSNRVEEGLISPWPLGRVFQDLAGLTHQRMAEAAAEVHLLIAGLSLQLK